MQTALEDIKLDPVRWAQYVRELTQHAPARDVQELSGVHASTISRWYDDENPTAPSARAVIAIARAFGSNVIEALCVAGYVSPSEAQMRPKTRQLPDYATSSLVRELARRAELSVAS